MKVRKSNHAFYNLVQIIYFSWHLLSESQRPLFHLIAGRK